MQNILSSTEIRTVNLRVTMPSPQTVKPSLLYFVSKARCCGAYNYTDYASVGWDKQYTINGKQIIATVPMMCCKTNDDVKLDDFASINERGLNSTFKNLEGCLKGETESINDQVRIFE